MEKPVAKLTGEDGNVFNLITIASGALRRAGMKDKSDEMVKKIFACHSYDKALQIINEYCEVQ